MTNREKYKNAHDLAAAFYAFCNGHTKCVGCPIHGEQEVVRFAYCVVAWLNLEAEDEKPLQCYFCDEKTMIIKRYMDILGHEYVSINCSSCNYTSRGYSTESEAVAAHNRVVKAMMAAKESEVKE